MVKVGSILAKGLANRAIEMSRKIEEEINNAKGNSPTLLAKLNALIIDGGGTPSNVIVFEDWEQGETVTIGDNNANDETPPILTISPGGTFENSKTITMEVNEPSTIYYTLDGSTPTESSLKYSQPLTITNTSTLKAFAKDTAGNSSVIQTITYTLKNTNVPLEVTITPPGGSYTSAQTVSITSNRTSEIYYTLDGSNPTTSSVKYSGSITIDSTKTLKAFAKDAQGTSSLIQTAQFTISTPSNAPGSVLVSDSFNRSDSTGLGTTDTGQTWEYHNAGIWGISNNQAILTNNVTNSGAIVDSKASDVSIEVKILVASAANKVYFRYLASNNYFMIYNKSVVKVIANVNNTVATFPTNFNYTSNQLFKITCFGDNIKVYADGALLCELTDSAHRTGTKHGFGANASSTGRFDDFKIISL